MLSVAINGSFLSKSMQGIVRYARELVIALDDEVNAEDNVCLVVPPDAHDVPGFRHIQVVPCGLRTGFAWEQIDFARYLRGHRDLVPLNLCNVAPVFSRPGVTAIHDVMYEACPEYYRSPRNRLSRLWHRMQYALVSRRERAILTVSEYSKREIERLFPRTRGKVSVVPNAWQHVGAYAEALDWETRYPSLKPGEYFFSLSTIALNKNARWIYEVAKRNPNLVFAMAGVRYEHDETSPPANIHMLGYVTDEDACALIRHCRAFLFPSLYEGFGLPPLEALALGAEVVSSNATSLPEVLGDAAHYVDPRDYDVNLDELLAQPVGVAADTLARYSWQRSSRMLRAVLEGMSVSESDGVGIDAHVI